MRPDLQKHFVVGAAIGAVVGGAVAYLDPVHPLVSGTLLGAMAGSAVGWFKEKIHDRKWGKGTYDPADAGWTGVGAGVGAVLASLLTYSL